MKCEVEDSLINGLLAVAETISDGNLPDMDMQIFMDETEGYIKEHLKGANEAFQPHLREEVNKYEAGIL